MENLVVFMLFVISILAIIKGGSLFVDSAVWIAQRTGIPTFLIGATVVSLATTLPELLVSSYSSFQGNYDVAISNAVGSVICNIGLILSISIISSTPKLVKSFFTKGSYLIFSGAAVLFVSRDGVINKSEGIFLIGFAILFILINILEAKHGSLRNTMASEVGDSSNFKNTIKFVLGAFLIIIGSRVLVDNGIIIANILGIPQQVISLTLIAIGTSLPELITTITALIKKRNDLSLGNILGANILNFLFVIGSSVMVSTEGLLVNSQTYLLDLPISLLLIALLFIGGIFNKLNKRLGYILIFIYLLYLYTIF